MKRVIWRPYWNYENEEKWLNEMAAKGWMLTDYTWCRYVFQEAPAGKYIYRIELLENVHSHPESQRYLRFLEEAGIEYVTHYIRWVYLRKKAVDGPFDLYTDLDSKIKRDLRIHYFWRFFIWLELSVGFINFGLSIMIWITERTLQSNMWLGILLIAIGFLFYGIDAPVKKRIKHMKKEKQIRES